MSLAVRRAACFRTAAIVFDDDVDLAAIDSSGLVDLRRRHEHAVDGRLSEVECWSSKIAEVADLDRTAIYGGRLFPALTRTGEGKSHKDRMAAGRNLFAGGES